MISLKKLLKESNYILSESEKISDGNFSMFYIEDIVEHQEGKSLETEPTWHILLITDTNFHKEELDNTDDAYPVDGDKIVEDWAAEFTTTSDYGQEEFPYDPENDNFEDQEYRDIIGEYIEKKTRAKYYPSYKDFEAEILKIAKSKVGK